MRLPVSYTGLSPDKITPMTGVHNAVHTEPPIARLANGGCFSGGPVTADVSGQMRNWKQYTIDGIVSIAIPDGAIARLECDDTMVVLTLPGEPATDIVMGLFPLENGDVVSTSVIQGRLADFMNRCVQSATRVKGVSIALADDVDDASLCVWQAVAQIEGDDHWWLARLYGRLGDNQVLLVHWNGPAWQLKGVVLQSFVSITLLYAGAPNTSRR